MKAEQHSNHYQSKSTILFMFIVWLGDAASRLVMLLPVLPPVGESPEDRTPTLCCEEHLLIRDNYPPLQIIVIRMIFTINTYNLSLATPLFIAAKEQKHSS